MYYDIDIEVQCTFLYHSNNKDGRFLLPHSFRNISSIILTVIIVYIIVVTSRSCNCKMKSFTKEGVIFNEEGVVNKKGLIIEMIMQ